MKLAHTIDANGFMLEPVFVDDNQGNTDSLIVDVCPDGFHKPKWDAANLIWAEGLDDATLLGLAKQAKMAELQAGLNNTLVGGFTSQSTGHTYVTSTTGEANMHGELTRFQLDPTLQTVQFYTINAGWLAHTEAQLQTAFLDGGKWKDAQYVQFNTLSGQAQSATTMDAVNAISWTPGTY